MGNSIQKSKEKEASEKALKREEKAQKVAKKN